jgi:hypothetical protein
VAGDGAWRGGRRGAARSGIGAPPRGGLWRADCIGSRDERSEELGISVGYCSVDEIDRGENVDRLVVVLERARSRSSDFLDSGRMFYNITEIQKGITLSSYVAPLGN